MKRECGDCQLCCKLVPVEEIRKKAGVRCEHQKEGVGCAIYAKRPLSCAVWNCGWIIIEELKGFARPDKSHYVISPDQDDAVNMVVDGKTESFPVLVIWVDPDFPEAYKDPKLLYLLNKNRILVKLCFSSVISKLLIPPCMSPTKNWHEREIVVDWDSPRAKMAIKLGLV